MIDQPSWSIKEYLELRDQIRDLPPEEQEAAIAEFFKMHPPGAGLRTYLGTQNFPSAPTETKNALSLRDVQGRERARMVVTQNGTPALEFLDSAGNVTHRYPE